MKKKAIIERLSRNAYIRRLIDRLIIHFQHSEICDINRDLTLPSQMSVLFVYKSIVGVDVLNSYHALYYHLNQMIRVMIEKGWSIDLCDCYDKEAVNRLCNKDYKIIVGQGPTYLDFCNKYPNAKKVLFCTENNPVVVEQKFKERVSYFSERHPSLKKYTLKRRVMFFTEDHLNVSDEIILMNSEYNEQSFKKYFARPFRINVNAITNKEFNLTKLNNNTNQIRKNFVVFGCTGFIHKGIDILLDAFKELPDYNLFIYGIHRGEKALFNKLKSSNTIDCGFVTVASHEFLTNVVSKSLFVILPSCSEGMSSGIATCMTHGLIPIITKDCGFDDNPDISILPDYSVETIVKTIKNLADIEDDELRKRRLRIINYAQEHFSISKFSESFADIITSISNSQSLTNN